MRGRAGLVLEISFSNRDGKFCHMNTWAWLMGWKQVEFFTTVHSWMALCCFACCIFHIANVPFNYGGKSYDGLKFGFSNFIPQFIPRIFGLSHLLNQTEISHMNPRWNLSRAAGQLGQDSGLMWRGPWSSASCNKALTLLTIYHATHQFYI